MSRHTIAVNAMVQCVQCHIILYTISINILVDVNYVYDGQMYGTFKLVNMETRTFFVEDTVVADVYFIPALISVILLPVLVTYLSVPPVSRHNGMCVNCSWNFLCLHL